MKQDSGKPRAPSPVRKRFGQHFLERAWADKVADAIGPGPGETFLEIGPGRGALTRPLAARAGRVVAVEIDRDLARVVREERIPNLTVEEGDFLDMTASALSALLARAGSPAGVRVAGNLPYNAAAPILFKLAELYTAGAPLVDATVMLQQEVAERLTAPPGTGDYSVLGVLMAYRTTPEIVLRLPPGAFRPMPKVRSAVVRLRFHPPLVPAADERVFTGMVRAIFTRRRKTLANALLAYPGTGGHRVAALLDRLGLDGTRRPETLAQTELIRLADALADPAP